MHETIVAGKVPEDQCWFLLVLAWFLLVLAMPLHLRPAGVYAACSCLTTLITVGPGFRGRLLTKCKEEMEGDNVDNIYIEPTMCRYYSYRVIF